MTVAPVFRQRSSGVLLHLTSLPTATIGDDAYRFIDFLSACGCTIWQMLPLGPTHSDESPYQSLSAFAIDTRFICRHTLVGLPWGGELTQYLTASEAEFFQQAYKLFCHAGDHRQKMAFQQFCQQQAHWLDDYALFREIRRQNNHIAWPEWPAALRDREPEAIETFTTQHYNAIAQYRFQQFLFWQQWQALKEYANSKDILLFGDMPIFVSHDSADVWANQSLFLLNQDKYPSHVAGVPPDYFSETGQRWGNPLYDWPVHKTQAFQWWQQRMLNQISYFDLIRIDHFRGFEAYWQIPASCDTAIEGQWQDAPGDALFHCLSEQLGALPLVAEDLGIITPAVTALRKKYQMPGMKILQFAFGSDADNPYLPHHHERHSIVYTGTHDNNTGLGWYQSASEQEKHYFSQYSGENMATMPWPLQYMAWQSVAQIAITPMQDILALDATARMNTPGTTIGNWRWKMKWQDVNSELVEKLRRMNQLFGRYRG